MKKIKFLVFLIVIPLSVARGQDWKWSAHLKCNDDVSPLNVITDNSNNVYLAGTYNNATLQIGTDTINNFGEQDGFICKFDQNGTLLWLKRIGGTLQDETVSLVIVGNNLYVAGNFKSPVLYFTPTNTLTNTDNFDSYLAQYDLNGNFIAATSIFYGTSVERVKQMIFDPVQNDLLFLGQFKSQLKYFDGITEVTVPTRSSTNKDLFIAKSNFSGAIQDTAIYTTTVVNSILNDINLSQDNGYYLSGSLYGTIYFDQSDSIKGNSTTNSDALVLKVNTNLDFQWARKGGGIGYDHANSANSDKFGNVYLTGKVESTVTFDSTATLQSHSIASFGAQDLYVAKYNKLGTLQWIKRKGDAGNDDGYGMAQRENLVQFCGNYAGEVVFNTDTLKSSGTSDDNTGFAIFNTKGNEIGAQSIGGTGYDYGEAISFSPNGNTIIAGYSNSPTLTIGDSSFINSSGTYNGFIASYYYTLSATFSSITNISCNGGNDGRLLVTPYFGVEPYNYSWSPNVTTFNDSLATSLTAGNYSVTITDSRDSTATTSIMLTEPSAINVTSTVTNVKCFEENNGKIDITTSGGTVVGNYSYSWQTISGSGVKVTQEDQDSLTAADYYLTVTDDNSCAVYDTFTVDQPTSVFFSGSTVDKIVIPPGSNGAVNLNAHGGTEPYQSYSWTGPASYSSSSDTITGLVYGGIYNITVTDANSCTYDTTFLVDDDTLLIAYISYKKNISCNGGSDGEATVSVENGSGLYDYSWTDGTLPIGGNFNAISNRIEGTYYVTVTDQTTLKTAEAYVILTEPLQPLSSTIIGENLTCNGNNSGIENLNVSGGTLPYKYSWIGTGGFSSNSEDLINLAAGRYYVTVTDKNGCAVTGSDTISEPQPMVITIDTVANILCHGELTAILNASTTGGVGPYSYQWDDPGNQTGLQATGLGAGNYTVFVTDNNDCEANESYQVTEPPELSVSTNKENVSCFGADDGSIFVDVAGGKKPYLSYRWQLDGSNFATIKDISGLSPGHYTFTITDYNGCIAQTEDTITGPPQIAYQSVNLTDASCNGYADGTISVMAGGSTGPYNYSSNGGTTFQSSGNFTGLQANDYTLVIRDANSCLSKDSVVSISEPQAINILSETATNITCPGFGDGSISISAADGAGGLTYSINDGINYFNNNGIFDSLSKGDYQVKVKDADNCEVSGSPLTINEPGTFIVDTFSVTHATADQNGSAVLEATGGTQPFTFIIKPPDADSLTSSNGQFSDLPAGNYQAYAIDNNGCNSSSLALDIISLAPKSVILYNAFSPNGDNINDVWNIGNIQDYPNCTVRVFNAWGNEIFSSHGYTKPWDGKYNGKYLPSGTYYYIIDLGDGSKTMTGPVNIVK